MRSNTEFASAVQRSRLYRHQRRRQRGVAVITALLLTTLAVTLVASLFWQQQVQVRSIENQRLQLQMQWVLRGALDWARLILREDAKGPQIDNLDEVWAVPLAETKLDQYLDNGHSDIDPSDAALSGYIVDAQSRYNLTNLVGLDGVIVPREVLAFGRLLSALRLNPQLAKATAVLMAAAKRKSSDPSSAASQPVNIAQVDDLLAVPGFSPEMVSTLKNYAVVLPIITPVNVNTASVEVLMARIDTLSLSDAAAIVASRTQAYFRDVPDFIQRFQGKPLSAASDYVSVKTDYFIVTGNAHMDRAAVSIQALIERNQAAQTTKVLWILEN